ncbi:MAG TPA: OmpA family protein [Sphingomicrobium sp.]|nr:OmpA family protein [Sphingomicrobium sp.]
MRKILLLVAALIAVPASAQLPGLRRRDPPPPVPVQNPIDVLRADFAAQSGGTIVYFAPGSAQLTAQAKTMLTAQAAWLRQHPEVSVRIEGHGDPTDTRDHALALGAERAAEARDYLILLGLPAAQLSAMTWGKERPGPPSATATIQLSSGAALVPAAG